MTVQAPDKYDNFRTLSASEIEDVDFSIALFSRNSTVAILAPHGGWIEPTTSEIAAAIAADRYSLYLFEGLKQDRPHSDLHITSVRFDEPKAVNLVVASTAVVTVHGRADDNDPYTVYVGGRDKALTSAITKALRQSGFDARDSGHPFPATNSDNICNRGLTHAGVQLELPRSLRDELAGDPEKRTAFGGAVAAAIDQQPQT